MAKNVHGKTQKQREQYATMKRDESDYKRQQTSPSPDIMLPQRTRHSMRLHLGDVLNRQNQLTADR